MKHFQKVGTNVYINNQGHMTKMAAMLIQDKNPSKISGTAKPIVMKINMQQLGLE